MIIYQIYQGIMMFLNILSWLLFIYWILSFFRPNFRLYDLLERFMEPLLRPFRRLSLKLMAKMRGGMMVDFSFIFAMLALRLVSYVVTRLFYIVFF